MSQIVITKKYSDQQSPENINAVLEALEIAYRAAGIIPGTKTLTKPQKPLTKAENGGYGWVNSQLVADGAK